MQVTINLKSDLLALVDEAKGTQSRSGYIVECIGLRFSGGDADKKALIDQLNTCKNEVEFLRQEYSKINDALAQRLLTDSTPKKSIWQRIRGH